MSFTKKKLLRLLSILPIILDLTLAMKCTLRKLRRPESTYRLSQSVVPVSYDLSLQKVDLEEFAFAGLETIDAKVLAWTNVVELHKRNLNTTLLYILDVNSYRRINAIGTSYNETSEIWSLHLERKLRPFSDIRIGVKFSGTMRDDMVGFYKSYYVDESGATRWLAATQFQPANARDAFPCFDEPALKATFSIRIVPPKGYSCLSNMLSNPTYNVPCSFERSPRMSSYLVSYVVSDFSHLANATANFRVWTRPGVLTYARYALRIGPEILHLLGRRFDEPYHLAKLDLVAVPDMLAGAMENWGLVTFDEWSLLYDELEAGDEAQQRVAAFVAHETSHQWFGNLATPEWWSYSWLSEGFAQYLEYMVVHELEPTWRMDQQFVVQHQQVGLAADSVQSSEPLTDQIEATRAEIDNVGSTITYDKGASVIRMMELTFGSDVFDAALRDYLKARKYNSATPGDLWKAFQKHVYVSRDPKIKVWVARFMKTWTEQPGYPVLSVEVKPNVIKINQKRFLLPNRESVSTDSVWWVPITWMSSTEADNGTISPSTKPVHWLKWRNAVIPNRNKDADWLLFNVQAAGFYRVNYDKDSWNKIIDVLKSDDYEKIPELNRAAIVNDMFNLARAELLDYETVFRAMEYLKRENNYLPFKSAIESLRYLLRRFTGTEDAQIFYRHVTSLLVNIYENLTYDDRPGDDRLTILLRREVNDIMCYLGHIDCIEKSRNYFSELKASGKPVPRNQRPTAYCYAIKYGNSEDWEYLWAKFRASNLAAEKNTILSALGCSHDPSTIKKYLLKTLMSPQESGIREPNLIFVFRGLTSVIAARSILEFAQEYQVDILTNYGNDKITDMVSSALPDHATMELAFKLNDMTKNNSAMKHLPSIQVDLEEILKDTLFEVNWFNKHKDSIIEYIKAKEKSQNVLDAKIRTKGGLI